MVDVIGVGEKQSENPYHSFEFLPRPSADKPNTTEVGKSSVVKIEINDAFVRNPPAKPTVWINNDTDEVEVKHATGAVSRYVMPEDREGELEINGQTRLLLKKTEEGFDTHLLTTDSNQGYLTTIHAPTKGPITVETAEANLPEIYQNLAAGGNRYINPSKSPSEEREKSVVQLHLLQIGGKKESFEAGEQTDIKRSWWSDRIHWFFN